MNVEIVGRPEFHMTLDLLVVEALMLLSKHHYDGLCRRVGGNGGFLYGWKNRRDWAEVDGDPTCAVSGSFRDLDLTLKLCEISRSLSLVTQDMDIALEEYKAKVRGALHRASELQDWKITL